MISLEDYNDKKEKAWELDKTSETPGNGIACPKCGAELHDVHTEGSFSQYLVLIIGPPTQRVACDCGFRGIRIL